MCVVFRPDDRGRMEIPQAGRLETGPPEQEEKGTMIQVNREVGGSTAHDDRSGPETSSRSLQGLRMDSRAWSPLCGSKRCTEWRSGWQPRQKGECAAATESVGAASGGCRAGLGQGLDREGTKELQSSVVPQVWSRNMMAAAEGPRRRARGGVGGKVWGHLF